MKWLSHSATHPGQRTKNEDYCLQRLTPEWACLVLADGLGGHPLGKVAAKLICQNIIKHASTLYQDFCHTPFETTTNLIAAAYADYKKIIYESYEGQDARTTLALIWGNATHWVSAHLGDSRIYYFNASQQCLSHTSDHSLIQQMVDNKLVTDKQMGQHPWQHVILNAINLYRTPMPEIHLHTPLKLNDALLLCSDGFWENVSEESIITILQASDPAQTLEEIIPLAYQQGGRYCDNITAQILKRIA